MKKRKKNKPRRSSLKYPALTKGYNSRIRGEYIDYDYVDKLSEEDKEFLNKFTEEWLNASFKKTEKGNYFRNNLHTTKYERKECYNRNNARNRCAYSIAKAKGARINADYSEIHEILEIANLDDVSSEYMEDALIDYIDSKYDSED